MLKLTTENGEIYVRASQIAVLQRISGNKTEIQADGRGWWVTETPEQIMAMSSELDSLEKLRDDIRAHCASVGGSYNPGYQHGLTSSPNPYFTTTSQPKVTT
jgi:hypothetical protein